METKTAEYQGKTLRYFHLPDGSVKFFSEDFFNILGNGFPANLGSSEFVYIEYQMAIVYADQQSVEFGDWLRSNFQDNEIGSFKPGK